MPDPWQVLGLRPGASVSEARAARRRLAKELHPDAHMGRDADVRAAFERRMTLVNEAVAAIVSDASRHHGAPGDHDPSDEVTFGIDLLPVRAFEMLFVAAYGLGDILDDEEPYRLDVYLRAPDPCFCRIDLVPDAGGSTIMLSVSSAEGQATPPASAIRDLLMAEVETL